MNAEELQSLKNRFRNYVHSFCMALQEDQRNIVIKREHTRQVCLNAVWISKNLGLGQQETRLVETIALFHDIGRFSQYQQHKTFDDSISVNHAALGAKVLVENNMLGNLPKHEQDLIVRSVMLHNVFNLPEGLDERSLLFARLIRDADKLDILRVMIEYFEQDEGSRAKAVALGLPDLPGYSQEVLACLVRGEMARKEALTTLNDFKLLQLAWLYDLNFSCALRMVVERDFIRKITEMLPRNKDIARAVEIVREYVSRKLKTH